MDKLNLKDFYLKYPRVKSDVSNSELHTYYSKLLIDSKIKSFKSIYELYRLASELEYNEKKIRENETIISLKDKMFDNLQFILTKTKCKNNKIKFDQNNINKTNNIDYTVILSFFDKIKDDNIILKIIDIGKIEKNIEFCEQSFIRFYKNEEKILYAIDDLNFFYSEFKLAINNRTLMLKKINNKLNTYKIMNINLLNILNIILLYNAKYPEQFEKNEDDLFINFTKSLKLTVQYSHMIKKLLISDYKKKQIKKV